MYGKDKADKASAGSRKEIDLVMMSHTAKPDPSEGDKSRPQM